MLKAVWPVTYKCPERVPHWSLSGSSAVSSPLWHEAQWRWCGRPRRTHKCVIRIPPPSYLPHCFLNAMRWTALLHYTIFHQAKAAKPTNHNLEPRKPWAKGRFQAWHGFISENSDSPVGSCLSQSPLPWSVHVEYDTVRFEAPSNPAFKLEATKDLYKYFCEVLFGLPRSCP